jgi:hypothetical protein
MDIRLIVWAGYELKESTTVSGAALYPVSVCDPVLDSVEVGSIHLHSGAFVVAPSVRVALNSYVL